MANREQIMTVAGCGTQIADDAVANGYMPVLVRTNGKGGDAKLALYDCNGIGAIDTNGDVIWESGIDGEEWADALRELDA